MFACYLLLCGVGLFVFAVRSCFDGWVFHVCLRAFEFALIAFVFSGYWALIA